jgi:glycosyltransferase involved in cell wall biosynthesis
VPAVVLPSEGPLAADLRADGIEVLVRPVSVIRRELLSAGGLARLAAGAARDAGALGRLSRRRGFALVHSNTSVVLGGFGAARLAGVPHVCHVREIYSGFAMAWKAYRALLGSAAALPCVSSAAAAQFAAGANVSVVSDALAIDAWRAPRAQARRTLGLSDDAPAVAVVGRVSDWKGQDVLVRALAQPSLRERGTIGVLAGEAWPGAEDRLARVLALASSLGVRSRVRLVGFRDDVQTIYGAADVIAVPSTRPDPLPGAAIEAAAAGCAVVASAHGGLPEIIGDRRTGRLVAPGDPTALAAAIAELLDHPDERASLGAAAMRDVRERFAPERLRAAIHQLYDSVLGGR